MQVVSPSGSPAPKFVGNERFVDIYGKLNDDFESKLKVGYTKKEEEERNNIKSWWKQDEEEEEEEFSFANVKAENSPITADEAFEDGQIRPVYPLFNRDLLFEPEHESLRSPLKKVFVEDEEATTEEESDPMGPYCSWSGRTVTEASPETCRKSNSTGFSKLWRFKDLVLRSNSDGKDAFVFLSHGDGGNDKNASSSSHSSKAAAVMTKLVGVKEKEKPKTTEKKKMKTKTKTKSAHERLYTRNRAIREEGKRRSYLPYKHVGFFTNVNGLTRNVHPF